MAIVQPASTRPMVLPALALAIQPRQDETGNHRFAALCFRGDEVLDVRETDGDPAGAGTWLRERAGSRPIVTATPQLAAELVGEQELSTATPVWDVLELAALLAPHCPVDSLDTAAAHFGLAREEDDLAGDARLVAGLFARLVALLEQTDAATLMHVARLAASLAWPLRSLFAEVERHRARTQLEQGLVAASGWVPGAPARKRSPLVPTTRPRPLDVERVVQQLSPGGSLAELLPGYEPRAEQVAMARAVGTALNEGGRLFVEAGTGTGKSVAYLLPAVALALRNQWRVVVATATTTLQDQLFQKDLPLVEAALGATGQLRACVLKGRTNYLCLRRWQALLHASDLQPHDRTLLIKTLFWLPWTETGDRAELRLSPREEEAWQRVSAVAEVCTPVRCAYHKLGACYLARARRAAEESHVVVANHALLLSDLANGSRVLPPYQVLVVDEAHHLEDEATNQFGWRLGERELASRLEALWSASSGARGGVGALPEALGALRQAAPSEREALGRAAEVAPAVTRCETTLAELGRLIHAFFERLAALLDEGQVGSDDGTLTIRLTGGVRAGSTWQEAEQLWAAAMARLSSVLQVAAELQLRLETLPAGGDDTRGLAAELANQVDFWQTLRQRMDAAVHAPDQAGVYWLAGSRKGPTWLCEAPLEVASILRSSLFADPYAAILVSATLAVDGSFDYVKARLGLEDADALAVGSTFDYGRAALLYVPHDVPDPTQPGYQRLVEDVLFDTILAAGGRTLALFTSRAQLRATYAALARRLAAGGVTLLAQGVNEGSRTRLLDAFRRGSRVALFGTSSFWEGIDVIGEALSCVVVARLPFAVPTEPIYAARAEQFEDPFGQHAVPQAILRFKQGFGRLIRSRSDRGAVVVLDRRLLTRNYGAVFVRSLPECTVEQGPASRTARVVADWLSASMLPPPTGRLGIARPAQVRSRGGSRPARTRAVAPPPRPGRSTQH